MTEEIHDKLENNINPQFYKYIIDDNLPKFNSLDYSLSILNSSDDLQKDFNSLQSQHKILEDLLSENILKDNDTLRVYHNSLGVINPSV